MSEKTLDVGNLENPILEFDSVAHIATDPIHGLSNWGPHQHPDLNEIRAYAVCAPQFKANLEEFWDGIINGFNEDVFVAFPGFSKVFGIPITKFVSIINPDKKSGKIATRYSSAVKDIPSDCDIAVIVLPYDNPVEARDVYNEVKAASFSREPKLKTQCIRKITLAKLEEIEYKIRKVRSEHSINLWNLATAVFTKVGGVPWKLKNEMSEVGCFIGMRTNTKLIDERRYVKDKIGICEVADSWGTHVMWVKEALPSMQRTREEGLKVIDINPDDISKLVESALDRYCRTTLGVDYDKKIETIKNKVICFHVRDVFSKKVLDAMEEAINGFGFGRYQIVRIEPAASARIYDKESTDNIPLRGLYWKENDLSAILYTHGRRQYRRGIVRSTYSIHKFDRVTPIGVNIVRQNRGLSIDKVLQHIMNLTGLCWYTTAIEIKMPVTSKIARRISELWKRGVLSDFQDIRFVL